MQYYHWGRCYRTGDRWSRRSGRAGHFVCSWWTHAWTFCSSRPDWSDRPRAEWARSRECRRCPRWGLGLDCTNRNAWRTSRAETTDTSCARAAPRSLRRSVATLSARIGLHNCAGWSRSPILLCFNVDKLRTNKILAYRMAFIERYLQYFNILNIFNANTMNFNTEFMSFYPSLFNYLYNSVIDTLFLLRKNHWLNTKNSNKR